MNAALVLSLAMLGFFAIGLALFMMQQQGVTIPEMRLHDGRRGYVFFFALLVIACAILAIVFGVIANESFTESEQYRQSHLH